MPLDFANMPSIEDIFGSDTRLVRRITDAGFTDITPLMLLPEHSLPAKRGFSAAADKRITELLLVAGIERRHYGYKLAGYLYQLFGRAEIAPMSALQVAVVRDGDVNFPMFAPLEIIKHLTSKYDHPMAIIDVMQFTVDGLTTEATTSHSVASIREDLRHLTWRLENIGLHLPGKPVNVGGFELQAMG